MIARVVLVKLKISKILKKVLIYGIMMYINVPLLKLLDITIYNSYTLRYYMNHIICLTLFYYLLSIRILDIKLQMI